MGGLLRVRPRLVSALAVFTICAGLALGLASEAIARTYFHTYTFGSAATRGGPGVPNPIDADGSVREYYAVVKGRYDRIIGYAFAYQSSTSGWQRWIHYDRPTMCRWKADSNDWDRLFRHERAHTRGWSHGEGNPSDNGAYYPSIGYVGGGQGC